MRRSILVAAFVVASLSSAALARAPMETNQLVDDTGTPIGTAANPLGVATSVPTAAAGKIAKTSLALSANAQATLAANPNRIAIAFQCASGGVSIDETGGALTAAGVGNGTLFIPTGTAPYFTPPIATLTAVSFFTATAQSCMAIEYLK